MVGRKSTIAVLFVCFVVSNLSAQAATHEEIVESCRQSVGRPIVQACMGGRRDMLEECRQKATPAVRACVIKEEQRIAATKAAPTAPKGKEEEAALKGERGMVAAGFVAPPRTIADITKSALSQFYYNRGNARASLARNEDALNDALKAWEVGQGAFQEKQDTRVIQFAGLQYLAVGRPKEAIAFWLKAVGLGEQPGRRGAMINAARAILVTNWSVHSQSARELVSDMFRRQAADPKLTRAGALQQAMNALIDGKGFVGEKGNTLFSGAPYSLIGDGG